MMAEGSPTNDDRGVSRSSTLPAIVTTQPQSSPSLDNTPTTPVGAQRGFLRSSQSFPIGTSSEISAASDRSSRKSSTPRPT